MSFAFDLNGLVPDYEVDGVLFITRHYEGGFIFCELILVEALPDEPTPGGWRVKYGYQNIKPANAGVDAESRPLRSGDAIEFTEWTPDDHLRHAAFAGIREDKKARDVVREPG